MSTPHGPASWSDLMGLLSGHEAARVLHTAVTLSLFEHAEGNDAATVAAACGTHPRATRILLDALCGLGLLQTGQAGGPYRLSVTARRFLRRDAPGSFAPFIEFDAHNFPYWEKLPHTVRTGKPAREPNMFQDDPAATERFIRAMHAIGEARGDAYVVAERIEAHARAAGFRRILDVGAGPGTYALAFLQRWTDAKATLFDLPGTMRVTRRLLDEQNAPLDRLELQEGDYRRDPLPAGHDLAWVSNILHGENEEVNQKLARNVHHALKPGGWLVIKEHILDETGTRPPVASLFAVTMLLFTAGRCYTFDEARAWYEAAGFTDIEEEPPRAPLTSSLVFARRA